LKTRLLNKERIIESLDATLRDLEIRGCWVGLKMSSLSYNDKIEFISSFWNVSKEAIEKAVYTDKALSE
tara:strand:+ start:285 stop:491 length:207 start_codon:yes stop_codon:yes gene_type:complete